MFIKELIRSIDMILSIIGQEFMKKKPAVPALKVELIFTQLSEFDDPFYSIVFNGNIYCGRIVFRNEEWFLSLTDRYDINISVLDVIFNRMNTLNNELISNRKTFLGRIFK